MTVETSLGISNVSVQPEVNRGIVSEPGQIVPEPLFVLSFRQSVPVLAGPALESALGRMKAIVGRGSERIHSGRGGGRRPRCSKCNGKHFFAGECRDGTNPPLGLRL